MGPATLGQTTQGGVMRWALGSSLIAYGSLPDRSLA